MKIICLLENTACRSDVTAEHGLSLYIEANGQKILFDMGQSELFAKNAQALGVDLSQVDLAVLSHGHYDHGGGLPHFLRINPHALVYINEHAFLPYYNGTEKYIGLDTALASHPRVVTVGDAYRLSNHLSLYSCNGKERKHSLGSFGLTRREGEEFLPDSFLHEQYLLIEENGKRVLISGCSHKGIRDIAEWFRPNVLIGGFHVSKLPLDKPLAELALALGELPTDYYTCHCTGTEQLNYMKQYLPRLHGISCGQTLVL